MTLSSVTVFSRLPDLDLTSTSHADFETFNKHHTSSDFQNRWDKLGGGKNDMSSKIFKNVIDSDKDTWLVKITSKICSIEVNI